MMLKELKKFALEKGVEPLGSKMEIIRAIQVAEGYQACFGTRPIADCPETDCLWHQDCLRLERAVRPRA